MPTTELAIIKIEPYLLSTGFEQEIKSEISQTGLYSGLLFSLRLSKNA